MNAFINKLSNYFEKKKWIISMHVYRLLLVVEDWQKKKNFTVKICVGLNLISLIIVINM